MVMLSGKFSFAVVCPGLIHDEDGVGARRDGLTDLGEMGVHRACVAPGQNQADGLASERADGAEDVDPFRPLIVRRYRTGSPFRPAARDLVLLTNPGFVLEPDFQFRPGG
jgi:hypothetical protein